MEIKRPLLLISNDDGFQAKGINSLVEMLKDIADIIVCAPDDARSGYSRAFDMVIGGINHGDNASVNTHYSGTMGVTIEGCLKYIPSLAFSLCDYSADADFEPLRPYIRQITQRVLDEGLPKGVCLNVNFPLVEAFKGVKVCRMAYGTWYNETIKEHHPRGYDYWWMVGHYRNDEPEAEDTDNWALSNGYVAITPTTIDVTAYEAMNQIKGWNL